MNLMGKSQERFTGTDPVDRSQKSVMQTFYRHPQRGRREAPVMADQSKIIEPRQLRCNVHRWNFLFLQWILLFVRGGEQC